MMNYHDYMENEKQYPFGDYTLTAVEAAKILHLTPAYVRQLAAKGEIPSLKFRKRRLFNKQELMDFIRNETALSAQKAKNEGHANTSSDIFQ